MVRSHTGPAAQAFEKAAQHALSSGEVVEPAAPRRRPRSTPPISPPPPPRSEWARPSRFRHGDFVILLSTFSSNGTTNTVPITSADALTVARAQERAVASATAVAPPHRGTPHTGHRWLLSEVLAAGACIGLAALWARRTRSRATNRARVDPDHSATP